MDPGKTGSVFRTTSWTLIVRARASREDFGALLTQYWSPLYAYLRRRGQSRDDAADLAQAFIAEVMIERDLIGKANPSRGRFRSFLMSALRSFVIDEHRRQRGRDGKRPATRLASDEELDVIEPRETDDPATAYQRQWAATVLNQTLQRLEQACRAEGMAQHWDVFEARVVRPMMGNCEAPDMGEVAGAIGLESAELASSMLFSAKRKFNGVLREVVEETVEDPAEADAELTELKGFLGM